MWVQHVSLLYTNGGMPVISRRPLVLIPKWNLFWAAFFVLAAECNLERSPDTILCNNLLNFADNYRSCRNCVRSILILYKLTSSRLGTSQPDPHTTALHNAFCPQLELTGVDTVQLLLVLVLVILLTLLSSCRRHRCPDPAPSGACMPEVRKVYYLSNYRSLSPLLSKQLLIANTPFSFHSPVEDKGVCKGCNALWAL